MAKFQGWYLLRFVQTEDGQIRIVLKRAGKDARFFSSVDALAAHLKRELIRKK